MTLCQEGCIRQIVYFLLVLHKLRDELRFNLPNYACDTWSWQNVTVSHSCIVFVVIGLDLSSFITETSCRLCITSVNCVLTLVVGLKYAALDLCLHSFSNCFLIWLISFNLFFSACSHGESIVACFILSSKLKIAEIWVYFWLPELFPCSVISLFKYKIIFW